MSNITFPHASQKIKGNPQKSGKNSLFLFSDGLLRRTSDHLLNPLIFHHRPEPLVEVNGIEPMTSCVQSRRSPS